MFSPKQCANHAITHMILLSFSLPHSFELEWNPEVNEVNEA